MVGERIKRQTYARLLGIVASEGADGLYTGQVAKDIVKAVKKHGGVMEVEDLGSYSTHSRPALSIPYRNHTVFTTQAPSSGSIVLSILNTLGGFEVSRKEDVDRARHTFVEAMKFGYGQRTLLGDPRESNPSISFWLGDGRPIPLDFNVLLAEYEPNVSVKQHEFLLPSTAAHIRSHIDPSKTHTGDYYDPEHFEVLNDRGTSAMVAADASGLVISLTTTGTSLAADLHRPNLLTRSQPLLATVNLYWGSRIMVPEWGLVLNDGMDDFSIEGRRNAFGYVPTPLNYSLSTLSALPRFLLRLKYCRYYPPVKPHKRPLSSMSPTIVENAKGEFVLAVSSAGGSRIISAVTQVVRNTIDFGMGTLQALASPRMHDQIYPPMLFMEKDNPAIGFSGCVHSPPFPEQSFR